MATFPSFKYCMLRLQRHTASVDFTNVYKHACMLSVFAGPTVETNQYVCMDVGCHAAVVTVFYQSPSHPRIIIIIIHDYYCFDFAVRLW